ncbi:hypothetical protein [uncultured Gammaproteobacteria bacterium]|uniref:hypothetical protein n=1 Tax=Bathymodiolus heckerae thiotrophic gill symbiont TaxID=1052212 RepID=UPI0010BA99D1|nr:hypothetical protein [Bathymodiolus heckerae thiotrophic gill symbiont]CAC9961394.1 hypothetical protein [uncultured Gammaproteobacteria bacterium]SHN90719.1 hypothetical protein BHECKSOX_945 [Bathymodiolus heckerae thiotrophic gill symbiont]
MFDRVLKSWGSVDFPRNFKQAFKTLSLEELPLMACCTHSGVIDKDSVELSILSNHATEQAITLKIGVFFCEILSGCACSDDPSQAIILENSYCELTLRIDRLNAQISFI